MRMRHRGFTLVEMIIVLVLISIIAGVALPYGAALIEAAAIKAERVKVEKITDALKRGWPQGGAYDTSTWTTADAVVMGNSVASSYSYGSTVFDAGLVSGVGSLTPITDLSTNHWTVKVARSLGYNVAFDPSGNAFVAMRGAAYVYPSQSFTGKTGEDGLSGEVCFNGVGRRRALMAGPPEQNVQRFLVLSFMLAEDAGTTLPTFTNAADYAAFFNWLWDVDTSVSNSEIGLDPTANSTVNAALNAVRASWNARNNGRSYLNRLIKGRIVQKKCEMLVKLPATAASTVFPIVGGYNHSLVGGVDTVAATPTVVFPALKTGKYSVAVGTNWGTVGSVVTGSTVLIQGDRVPEGRKVWIVQGTTSTDSADPTAGGTVFARLTATSTAYTMVADMIHEWY